MNYMIGLNCERKNNSLKFFFSANELRELYMLATPIKGTQKYHSFIPVSENEIEVKIHSNSVQHNN